MNYADAANGDQSAAGKCGLGHVFGLTPSSLNGPCDIPQWTAAFTGKLAGGSLGGEVYARSEMVDHMSLIRDFYEQFGGLPPGMIGLEDCASLFTHLHTEKTAAEKYLARRFLSIQQSLEHGELDNV